MIPWLAAAALAAEPVSITIAAMGDVIPHANVRHAARHAATGDDEASGWAALLADAGPALHGADLAFVNLETPIAPTAGPPTRAFVFDAPPALAAGLARLGVDVVSTANNHGYDQGLDGIVQTLHHARDAGLANVGTGASCADAWAPHVATVRGVRVGWLAVTQVVNAVPEHGPQAPCVARWHDRTVHDAVTALRARADVVIVSVHWGAEYDPRPSARQREGAALLANAGADVILGHHAHVLQPITVDAHDGRPVVVAYGLGNALSNQGWSAGPAGDPADADVRDTVVLTVRLDVLPGHGVVGAAIDPVPLWTDNASRATADPEARLRVVAVDPEHAAALRAGDTARAAWLATRRARILAAISPADPPGSAPAPPR